MSSLAIMIEGFTRQEIYALLSARCLATRTVLSCHSMNDKSLILLLSYPPPTTKAIQLTNTIFVDIHLRAALVKHNGTI